ncbi:MAG: hypothetical protein VW840_13490, partial [Gammaproteobacteria bacterium]
FISGDLAGQARHIETYTGSTKSITVSQGFTSAPADGDEFLSLERLAKLGFDTVSAICCSSAADVVGCHHRWKAGCFGRSSLPTDGIVIRIADHDKQRELGSSSKAPRYAMAMK